MGKNYDLRFLPMFADDLDAIVDYITVNLQNPDAAIRLIDDVKKAIFDRLPDAEAFEPYPAAGIHPYPYYYIRVRNYLVFYVVIGNVMEVRRILYGARDMNRWI